MAEDKEAKLVQILTAQNELLDGMLEEQRKVHDTVKERRWAELEDCISRMGTLGDSFVELDQKREELVAGNRELYFRPAVEDLFATVRSKLSRSRIENHALSAYVHATQDFIYGVLDYCIPQQRNTRYTYDGRLVKPQAQSMVVNASW
ncbi:MAG: hypothetical protein J1D88_08585 [Treponema sp.]|nr:hypothetical protein [Treponema sp.]